MFKVGDKVRVKAHVKNPMHAWGRVKPGDIGVIVRLGDWLFKVDFPAQKNWSAYPPEMELVEEAVAKKLYTVKDIKGTRAYQQLKDSAESPVVLGMLVKRYLKNLKEEKNLEIRTRAVSASFTWEETEEGQEFWERINNGGITTLAHLQAFNKLKAKKPRPNLEPMPIVPPPAPAIGRGERPEGATHWTEKAGGRWLKVDGRGVVFHMLPEGGRWREYYDQHIGRRHVDNAIALDEIPRKGRIPKPPQPKIKPVEPEPPVVKKAPRLGWW